MNKQKSGIKSILTFLASLAAGTLGIYIGASIILGTANLTTALTAALIGAIVWGIASFFLGWIPLLGSFFTLIAWLGAIKWIYPGGWITASQIAVFAWLSALLMISIASFTGLAEDADAIGVPGA